MLTASANTAMFLRKTKPGQKLKPLSVTDMLCFFFSCNSNVGALWSKPSKVSLGSRCYLAAIATHELGHLLGLGHEQNRPDRDQYIDILWENIHTGHSFQCFIVIFSFIFV